MMSALDAPLPDTEATSVMTPSPLPLGAHCDNLFNPDPYYQQGGDMVRVGGLEYTCTPGARIGARIELAPDRRSP